MVLFTCCRDITSSNKFVIHEHCIQNSRKMTLSVLSAAIWGDDALNRDDIRPSPEAMLKLAQAEEVEAELGKLKIFLGYAAGVGKTYAMLEAARQRKADGRDVVAGYVESHGRAETDALLEGLEVLPRRDCDLPGGRAPGDGPRCDPGPQAADRPGGRTGPHQCPRLAAREALAGCGRAPGRRDRRLHHGQHPAFREPERRGGPDHRRATVRETVPDRLLDQAVEITLVDIPPEDLLAAAAGGEGLHPRHRPPRPCEKFFRPGNLMALRELSLRRTASRVDDQMRAYMETQSIAGPWPTAERLLVCVSGSPYSEKLIRATRRLADELKAPWFTVYIETPGRRQVCPGKPGAYLARPAPGRKSGCPGGDRHR